jgi:hypothetical protein
MSEQMERTVCAQQKSSEATQMLYARMLRVAPELASPRLFDCYFGQNAKEGPVLWEALDAWKVSGLPAPQGFEELKARSKLPQTRMRFMSDEERHAQHRQPETSLPPTSETIGAAQLFQEDPDLQ